MPVLIYPPSLLFYHSSRSNRMAVETTMEITMALGSFFRFISLVLLLVPATGARYLTEGASTTSSGLMPMDGTSPRPTRAPDWNRGLNDLRRRADSIISPAPSNWCGLIDGDYSESEIYIPCSISLGFKIILSKSDQPKPVLCLVGSLPPVYSKVATQNAARS